MVSLIDETDAARLWVDEEIAALSGSTAFGRFRSGVIWVDEPGPDGVPVGGPDPAAIEAAYAHGLPTNREHDPGLPTGRALKAKTFETPTGRRFVAAVFGYYTQDKVLSYHALGIDPEPAATLPLTLPTPRAEWWLELLSDPREIETSWLDEAARDAPLTVVRKQVSHNSADPIIELLSVGLPYAALVWNPLVTAMGKKAGEDLYARIHAWLGRLWIKLDERKSPVVSIVSHMDGCEVRFLIRGKDRGRREKAHEALALAAVRAADVVAKLLANKITPASLTYEYDGAEGRWYLSFLLLDDGRIASDRIMLTAVEHLPPGLSLGLVVTTPNGS